ncbi:Putative frequency clock protein [Septoria linicola]|uniref:Frequency clock protein n=1 Tax=Septoria linicola TaxID=215465 RepID=A0A9Q9END5_9PEZI|nr:Putative frequency clock protein [Septoria linicola]
MASKLPNPTIVMTPPVQLSKAASPHPRRPPSHRSVSLRHSQKSPKESDTSSDNSASRVTTGKNADSTGSKNSNGSPSSLQPLARDSSGESSNAEQWFQKSNNDVHDNSASFADNDPPFFMRHSSSSETPPDAQGQYMRSFLIPGHGPNSLPLRTGLLRLGGTEGSSTEDFRSVIDDLTIENKNLKRRLKKYEKLHDSHLKDEKLFEVRIHGLAPHKKRELEDTLRKFASSLAPSGFPSGGYEGVVPALTTQKTASSQTQASDSAYASMSGQGSGQGSALSGADTRHKHMASTSALKKQNIHTYLHHIPEGLLPQAEPMNMSERAKKKLVVRRLEQIFAGKGAVAGLHQHPIQQQEVSQSAARDDRAASEAQGSAAHQEGSREARIMFRERKSTNENTDSSTTEPPITTKLGKKRTQQAAESQSGASSEQRPTRPLDLDPHRAQIPVENIKYMRHLGFSPPNPHEEEAQEGHGWVYLNLLINLAQLHTISVTSDFVRKALGEFSHKFEISNDGRKVRWKGGCSVTRTSSSGGGSSIGLDTPDGQSPRKRPKLVHRESDRSTSSNIPHSGASVRKAPDSKLVYTPLFFHKDSTDDGDVSSEEEEEDDEMSPYPLPLAGDSSGMTSSGRQTTATKKVKKREDGPIIFYNNARFCTDLSGDRKTNGNANAPPYTPATSEPVGRSYDSTDHKTVEKRGPLAEAFELPEPMDLSDNPIPQSLELSFPHRSPVFPTEEERVMPVDLEATGIGGVWPTDNFAIQVESRHILVDEAGSVAASANTRRKHLPIKFARILDDGNEARKSCGSVRNEILSVEKRDLRPSQLPAALCYMPYGEGSTGDDASDFDDEISMTPESPGDFPPATAPQPVKLHYASSDYDDDDDSDAESDSSVDLLAAARQIDPEAIRQQEREYDAQYAERLAEAIPAGSSAATAGGGSGFASPHEDMSREDYEQAVRASRKRQAAAAMAARQSTTDSMRAIDPRDASDVADEEMNDVAD